MSFKILSFALSVVLLAATSPVARAEPPQSALPTIAPSESAADAAPKTALTAATNDFPLPTNSLTDAVLLKEIEIERLNEHFRLESTHEGYLRPWRQFVYGEANAILTDAGLIKGMAINWQDVHYPHTFKFFVPALSHGMTVIKKVSVTQGLHKVSPMTSEQIQEPQLLGQLINAGGDVFEIGINCYRQVQLHRIGYDSGTYRRRVQKLIGELDALLEERHKFVVDPSTYSTSEIEAMKSEGELLSDMRDLVVLNYLEYHASAQRLIFFENAAYVTDFLKNAVGVAGNIVQLDGAHAHRARYTGFGGLGTLLSGVFIMITPVFGRITGNTAGLMDRRVVKHDFKEGQIHSAEEFIDHKKKMFERVGKLGDTRLVDIEKRRSIYDLQQDVLLSRAQLANTENKRARGTTRENIFFASVVGTTKVSLGICNILGGWRYYNRPAIAGRLSAAGNTSYGAGTAVNVVETARVRYAQEVDYQRRRGKGLTRAQVIKTNLNRLDAMEKQIKL